MFYHASQTAGIVRLEPRVSNHGRPLVYVSNRRENVLVYLSNAVEKFCRETGFLWDGPWETWASYGFGTDGRQRIEEYYPNALKETYGGVSGYIYRAERIDDAGMELSIPGAFASKSAVDVVGCEWIPDAYEAILQAEREGKLTVVRYEQMSEASRRWSEQTAREEYAAAKAHPEYRHFLRAKFKIEAEEGCDLEAGRAPV